MKLLVNAPVGAQEIIEVGEGGGYFDSARVLWDERINGPLPLITLGGMKRVGDNLVFDEQLMAVHNAAKNAEQAKSVRSTRNDKLKDCDWTQLADSTADKAAWATHRQALRDITSQPGFPWTIEWPEQP